MICLTLFLIPFIFTISYATNPHYRLQITPSVKSFFRVGDSLSLNCRLIPADAKIFPLRVTLPINSGPLSGRIRISEEPNNLTVTIKELQVNDTGWYNCEADDNTDPIHKSIYVTIQAQHEGDCPANTFFSCGNRLCIPKRYVCDGFTDCPNDADESADICGVNPCDNKIGCEDGRCIAKQLCCLKQVDDNCPINNLVPCCADYLEQLATIRPVADIAFKDSLIRSTVYTMASCAVAVFFFVAILIVAIYRVHMRRSLLVNRPSPPTARIYSGTGNANTDCIYENSTNEMFEPLDPIDLELAYNQYESDDIMLSISQIPKPPLYSEALNHPIMPYNEPPPPYSPPNTPPVPLFSPQTEATSSTSEAPEETAFVSLIAVNTTNGDEDCEPKHSNNTNSDGQTSQ